MSDSRDVFEFAVRDLQLALGDDRMDKTVIDLTSHLGRHEQVTIEVDARGETDASWFTLEPKDVSLQDGETTSVQVTVAVPEDTPAGEYEFAVRAYAVSAPQTDFTTSQVSSVQVAEEEEGDGVPIWLLIVAAVIALLVIGGAIFLFTRGGGESGGVDDVVGQPVTEAISKLGDGVSVQVFSDGSATESDSCVFLQTPAPGEAAETVTLLTTRCPTPAPVVVLPAAAANLCQVSFDFCQAVSETYPDPPNNVEWQQDALAMVTTFTDTFTVEGVDTPNVVGLPLVQARAELQDANLTIREVQDGGGNQICSAGGQALGQPVLLQHPFAAIQTATTTTVTLVLTSCPADAQTAAEVNITSLIDLVEFANLPAAVPEFAQAIAGDEFLGGPEFLDSEASRAEFGTQVEQFRQHFAVPRVPDVVGKSITNATTLLENLGLTVTATGPAISIFPAEGFCVTTVVASQDPSGNPRIADLTSTEVALQTASEVNPCFDPLLFTVTQNMIAAAVLHQAELPGG